MWNSGRLAGKINRHILSDTAQTYLRINDLSAKAEEQTVSISNASTVYPEDGTFHGRQGKVI